MSNDELRKAILDLCETYQPRKPGLAKAINDLILLASANASELTRLRECIGLFSTAGPPGMVMDADNPISMAHKTVEHVTQLRERVRRLTAEKYDMCNRNALLRARPDIPTERLAEHDRLVSEMSQLREAVKLLGAEANRHRADRWKMEIFGMSIEMMAVNANPIAAAAVRGEP